MEALLKTMAQASLSQKQGLNLETLSALVNLRDPLSPPQPLQIYTRLTEKGLDPISAVVIACTIGAVGSLGIKLVQEQGRGQRKLPTQLPFLLPKVATLAEGLLTSGLVPLPRSKKPSPVLNILLQNKELILGVLAFLQSSLSSQRS